MQGMGANGRALVSGRVMTVVPGRIFRPHVIVITSTICSIIFSHQDFCEVVQPANVAETDVHILRKYDVLADDLVDRQSSASAAVTAGRECRMMPKLS